ncbi:MAG: serine hydrolase domain-containing protein [Candidatus Hodarchaeota archaeon]
MGKNEKRLLQQVRSLILTGLFFGVLAIRIASVAQIQWNVTIDALVKENYQKGVYDGSVLVARDGQVILSQGYGFADREKKIPNTPQTKFRIASITKQFTAMAILLLQQQGKLNVEDNICNYITTCPEIFKPVKIRHLLSHSSGIPGNTNYSFPGDQMVRQGATLYFQPGEQFVYQDVGYNLAGRIIETVSGQSYASFLKQNIFEPLGMSNSGVDDMKQTDLAKGYSDAQSDIAKSPVWGMFAEGAVYSTVEDLYRWDQALYTDKLLPQSSLKVMFTAQAAVPDGKYYGFDGSTGWSYGFGWFIAPKELGYVIHGGIYPGYRAEIRRYIDDKTVIILLTNQEAVALHDTAEAIAAKLFGK